MLPKTHHCASYPAQGCSRSLRASTQTSFRAFDQLPVLTYFIRTCPRELNFHLGKQLHRLQILLLVFLSYDPTEVWEPIGTRESAVAEKPRGSGWAKAFNEDLKPNTSGLDIPGLRLKVDDVIQSLGLFHCLGAATKVLGADGCFKVALHDITKWPDCYTSMGDTCIPPCFAGMASLDWMMELWLKA